MPSLGHVLQAGSGAHILSLPQTTASALKQLIRAKLMLFKSQTSAIVKIPLSTQTGTKTEDWKLLLLNLSITRQEISYTALVSHTLVQMVLNIPRYIIQHCANMTEFLCGFQGAIEDEIACRKTTLANVYLEYEKCYCKEIV